MAYEAKLACQHLITEHGVSTQFAIPVGISGNKKDMQFTPGMEVTCYGPRRGYCDHQCQRVEVVLFYAAQFGEAAIRKQFDNRRVLGEMDPQPAVEPESQMGEIVQS